MRDYSDVRWRNAGHRPRLTSSEAKLSDHGKARTLANTISRSARMEGAANESAWP